MNQLKEHLAECRPVKQSFRSLIILYIVIVLYYVINCPDLRYDSWDHDSDFVEEDGPTASFSNGHSTTPVNVKHSNVATSHCPSTATVSSAGNCHSSPIVIDSDKMVS